MCLLSTFASLFDKDTSSVFTSEEKREYVSSWISSPPVDLSKVVCEHNPIIAPIVYRQGPVFGPTTYTQGPRRSTRTRTPLKLFPGTVLESPTLITRSRAPRRSRATRRIDPSYVERFAEDESPAPSPNLPKPRKPIAVPDRAYRPSVQIDDVSPPCSPVAGMSRKRTSPSINAEQNTVPSKKRKVTSRKTISKTPVAPQVIVYSTPDVSTSVPLLDNTIPPGEIQPSSSHIHPEDSLALSGPTATHKILPDEPVKVSKKGNILTIEMNSVKTSPKNKRILPSQRLHPPIS